MTTSRQISVTVMLRVLGESSPGGTSFSYEKRAFSQYSGAICGKSPFLMGKSTISMVGWMIVTYSLVVWNMNFIFPNLIGDDDPI